MHELHIKQTIEQRTEGLKELEPAYTKGGLDEK